MQMIAVDTMGPFPESDNKSTHIMVVGDYAYQVTWNDRCRALTGGGSASEREGAT